MVILLQINKIAFLLKRCLIFVEIIVISTRGEISINRNFNVLKEQKYKICITLNSCYNFVDTGSKLNKIVEHCH